MPRTKGEKLDFAVAENIAAIAMEMAASKKRERAYKSALGDVGFPEFYQVAIRAAIALEKVATKKGIEWGDQADWIATTEAVADAILQWMIDAGTSPAGERLDSMVEASIQNF